MIDWKKYPPKAMTVIGKVFFRFGVLVGALASLSPIAPLPLLVAPFWLLLIKIVGRESYLISPLALLALLALIPQGKFIKAPEQLNIGIRAALSAVRIAVQLIGVTGTFLLMILSIVRYEDEGLCYQDNIDSTTKSPDGKRRAELHFCDAWPDSSFYLDITGDVSSGFLERHPTYEAGSGVTMKWIDNNTLQISPMSANGVTAYAGVRLQGENK
jgi:hypothetical protein